MRDETLGDRLLLCEREDPSPVRVEHPLGVVAVVSVRCPEAPGPNEDAALVLALASGDLLLAVADGVGGLPGGAAAARLALETLADAMAHWRGEPGAGLLSAFDAANAAVLETRIGSACTLAAAVVGAGVARAAHAGDALVMVVGQRGRMKFATLAHNPTSYAVEAGLLTEREAIRHEDRPLVTNLVGSAEMRVDVGPTVALAPRDSLLLASDAAADNLVPEELADTVRTGDVESAVERARDAARARMLRGGPHGPGHPDDLTLLVFRPRG